MQTIDDLAYVRRFQDKREPALDGEKPDTRRVWSEVRPDDFDPLTGFVMGAKSTVAVFRYPEDFVLKQFDLLMVFQGVPGRIGQVGLVVDDGHYIPSRVTCIIRTVWSDPAGLFFWLRRESVREELARRARYNPKNGKSFLSLDTIRKFEVDEMAVLDAAKQAREIVSEYIKTRKRIVGMISEIQERF